MERNSCPICLFVTNDTVIHSLDGYTYHARCLLKYEAFNEKITYELFMYDVLRDWFNGVDLGMDSLWE